MGAGNKCMVLMGQESKHRSGGDCVPQHTSLGVVEAVSTRCQLAKTSTQICTFDTSPQSHTWVDCLQGFLSVHVQP